MKTATIIYLGTLLLSGIAFADPDAGSQPAAKTQTLNFEDLKTACQNPAAYHNQVAPTNIQVSCTDVQTKWVQLPATDLQANNSRLITTAVTSDKYSVNAVSAAVPMPEQSVGCDTYKEVAEQINTIRAVACADIIAFTGSSTDFCTAAADSMRSSNANAVVSTDTGRTMNFCSQGTTPASEPSVASK